MNRSNVYVNEHIRVPLIQVEEGSVEGEGVVCGPVLEGARQRNAQRDVAPPRATWSNQEERNRIFLEGTRILDSF